MPPQRRGASCTTRARECTDPHKINLRKSGAPDYCRDMPDNAAFGDAVYLAWKLDQADAASAGRALSSLIEGEKMALYRLCSWVVVNNEVRALVAPAAPLARIAEAVWKEPVNPTATRFVATARGCAILTRGTQISSRMKGFPPRPELRPLSSAA
jgi:hypothetical protein